MIAFVKTKEFERLNIGFALDEGIIFNSNCSSIICNGSCRKSRKASKLFTSNDNGDVFML